MNLPNHVFSLLAYQKYQAAPLAFREKVAAIYPSLLSCIQEGIAEQSGESISGVPKYIVTDDAETIRITFEITYRKQRAILTDLEFSQC